jgi:hypothetical protein
MSFGASRRCCRSYASRRTGEAEDHRGPRLDQPLENNSFAGFIRQRELRWDSLRSRLGAKFFWLQPGCRAALALCPRLGLRFCFVVPANADIAMYGSPRTCWFKPTRQGPAAAHLVSDVFRQRQCCLSNRCKLVSARRPFWLGRPDITLLAGDFVPGFQDYQGGAGP